MPTKIEWTDETWNPVTGCTKVSAGCKNCYAERIAKRFWGDRKFTDVQCHPERLEIPLHWKKPRRIFVCSTSDLFHEDVPAEFIISVFEVMFACPQHTFQVLTKRPERFSPVLFGHEGNYYLGGGDYLPNVWLGVSVENNDQLSRTTSLVAISYFKHFISFEPLLENIGVIPWLYNEDLFGNQVEGHSIDWVIVGAETGPGARYMNPDWARSIRDQCGNAGIPFFMKQMTGKALIPDDLMIREYPQVVITPTAITKKV